MRRPKGDRLEVNTRGQRSGKWTRGIKQAAKFNWGFTVFTIDNYGGLVNVGPLDEPLVSVTMDDNYTWNGTLKDLEELLKKDIDGKG